MTELEIENQPHKSGKCKFHYNTIIMNSNCKLRDKR